MNFYHRRVIFFLYIKIIINNSINAQSHVKFSNENDTDILFDIKDVVMLNRKVTDYGSGDTTESATDATMSIALTSIDPNVLSSSNSSTLLETIILSSVTPVSNESSTIMTSTISISSTDDDDVTSTSEFLPTSTFISAYFTTVMTSSAYTTTTFTNEYATNAQTFVSTFNLSTITNIPDSTINSTISNTELSTTNIRTTTTTFSPYNCNSTSEVTLPNGTCTAKHEGAIFARSILRNSNNSREIAEALVLYFTATANLDTWSDPNIILPPTEIDNLVNNLTNVNLSYSSRSSFIMSKSPHEQGNIIISGASFTRDIGGQTINSADKDTINDRSTSVAAVISDDSLVDARYLNILIIDEPTLYENLNIVDNKKIASSIIVAALKKNVSASNRVNISLYFKLINDYDQNFIAKYECAFYDTKTSRWNDSGCIIPKYNPTFDRYECSCNHLTTFGLIRTLETCNNETHTIFNKTCRPKDVIQNETVSILRSNSTNSSIKADALSSYISSITNTSSDLNSANTLAISEIDNIVDNLRDVNLTKNTPDSFLLVKQPHQDGNVIILGASFTRDRGGDIVSNTNASNVNKLSVSTAAIISNESLDNVTSLNILIINNPITYKNSNSSTDHELVSSVIVVGLRRNNSSSSKMNISLYFQLLSEYKRRKVEEYACSFYNTTTSEWSDYGCARPMYNKIYNRYECSCNHTTSFALIWSSKVSHTRHLNAQDIASLVFQSISILCFLAIIIHGLTIRVFYSTESTKARHLLPLISCAITMILFIFYIALGMTVYTKTPSENENEDDNDNDTKCFFSASLLMFFVYFFLIFMFCVKTSIGYFNYLRFVQLFPEPSYRKLFLMLLISFFISITWVSFAAGFNSNPSYNVIQLKPYKLCWFTRKYIYYFLTIPVCLFLFINLMLCILIAKRIINHVRNSTSPHQSYERMKQCVIVLLSSCITQGIGWLFGPVITVINPTAEDILGWFFVMFNGLEGLWAIVLYIIVRSQHMDETRRVTASRVLTNSTRLSSSASKRDVRKRSNRRLRNRYSSTDSKSRREWPDFTDLHDAETNERTSSAC